MSATDLQPGFSAPPKQRPYDQALQLGLDALQQRPPSAAALASLGAAAGAAGALRVPLLGRCCCVDVARRAVTFDPGDRLRVTWAVLAVHYLAAGEVPPDGREVSFGYFTDCRSYLSVFGQRILGRFLATSGRSADRFSQLAEKLGATRLPATGLRYRFALLPRVPIDFIRYEGDDELSPGANVVYRADAERLLPAEDRVVAAELLLDALAGKPLTEGAENGPPAGVLPGSAGRS